MTATTPLQIRAASKGHRHGALGLSSSNPYKAPDLRDAYDQGYREGRAKHDKSLAELYPSGLTARRERRPSFRPYRHLYPHATAAQAAEKWKRNR